MDEQTKVTIDRAKEKIGLEIAKHQAALQALDTLIEMVYEPEKPKGLKAVKTKVKVLTPKLRNAILSAKPTRKYTKKSKFWSKKKKK
jgi:hypothetical protein